MRKLTGLSLIEWLFIPFMVLGNLPFIVRDMWLSWREKREAEGVNNG